MKPIPQLGYSIDEGAKMMGVGRTTIYKEIKSGRLKVVKLGRRTIVPADSIKRLLETPVQ